MYGENIRELRKEQSLTLVDLARKAGIAKGTLSEIENNKTNPSLATLDKIANALGLPVDRILINHAEKKYIIEDNHGNTIVSEEPLSERDIKDVQDYIRFKIAQSKEWLYEGSNL